MSQMGMQMPGRQRTKPASINVYTGLAFCACAALTAAIVIVGMASMRVAPEGGVLQLLSLHPETGDLRLNDAD